VTTSSTALRRALDAIQAQAAERIRR
jgi:hypothetical protein